MTLPIALRNDEITEKDAEALFLRAEQLKEEPRTGPAPKIGPKMHLSDIYLDRIEHLGPVLQEALIREAPHTRILTEIPPDLDFLAGDFIDFGFEDLPVPLPQKQLIFRAFSGDGVRVPGTHWKLRHDRPGDTKIEVALPNDEVSLPAEWPGTVVVLTGNDITWVGALVRPDRVGNLDMTKYDCLHHGYRLRQVGPSAHPPEYDAYPSPT